MIIKKAFNIRLYPNKVQANFFNKSFGCARLMYNECLKRKIEGYKSTGKTITPDMKAIKLTYRFMKNADSQGLSNSVMDLNGAFANFFKTIKNTSHIKFGFPKFKSKHDKQSYRNAMMKQDCIKENRILIPKAGLVRFHGKIDVTNIKHIWNITISKSKRGNYYCSICCDYNLEEFEHTGEVIGIDIGIKDLMILSNGTKIDNPKFLKKSERKLKHSQRVFSKKKKGSKNREKARKRLAIAHEKLSNQRKDYLHKVTTSIVKNYDVICMEDLNVKGMLKNHSLAKAIQDSSFGAIASMLDYKARWHNRTIVKVGRFYPSSKTCSCCGYKKDDLTLGDREWTCPKCHTHHDRDVNAAKNILNEGLNILDNNTVGTTGIQACGVGSSKSEMAFSSMMKQENLKLGWTAGVENHPSSAGD